MGGNTVALLKSTQLGCDCTLGPLAMCACGGTIPNLPSSYYLRNKYTFTFTKHRFIQYQSKEYDQKWFRYQSLGLP